MSLRSRRRATSVDIVLRPKSMAYWLQRDHRQAPQGFLARAHQNNGERIENLDELGERLGKPFKVGFELDTLDHYFTKPDEDFNWPTRPSTSYSTSRSSLPSMRTNSADVHQPQGLLRQDPRDLILALRHAALRLEFGYRGHRLRRRW